ncbi:MAG TPA: serine hydrolase domain-containing protein [Rubricoccaceae bacterium]|jgi:CubicO group peptidase (beta-lactamase class C family)
MSGRLALVALALLTALPARAQDLPARIDSLARAFVAETGAPSLVVALTRGGVRSVAGYGLVDGMAPDAQTRYEVGSVTKAFTSLALAQAVGRGEVTLDTPVQDLLPDSVRLTTVGRPITLGDLASHTSGLPRLPVPFMPTSILDPYADYDEADLMRFAATVRPDSAGAGYSYSNVGTGLLAWVLARRAGVGVEALLERDVAGPLGLTATTMSGDAAQPHTTSGTPIAPWSWTDALAGAGGLRSNTADLLTLAEAVARPERAPALAGAIRLAATPRSASAGRFRVGLAWHLLPEAAGPVRGIFHNGATFGSVAFVGVLPEADAGVVLLANTGAAGPLDALAGQILRVLAVPTP